MPEQIEIVEDPIAQVSAWMDEARDQGIKLANAAALATSSADGLPDVRYVLVKGITGQGCEFYTNSGSAKAMQLWDNPNAAIVIYWRELNRQVRARGPVAEMDREQVAAYFKTRPRDSQISAIASLQSRPLADEKTFQEKIEELTKEHEGSDVPLPGHWTGYVLCPLEIEFWLEGKGRMHKRVRYFRQRLEDSWDHELLYP